MVDLSKPPNMKKIEKIAWFSNAPVKLYVVILIFVLSFILAVSLYLFLDNYLIIEFALVLSFLIFPFLPIVLVFLLNRYKVIEKLTDDWYHPK